MDIPIPRWSDFQQYIHDGLTTAETDQKAFVGRSSFLYLPKVLWDDLDEALAILPPGHATMGQLLSFLLIEGLVSRQAKGEEAA